MIYFVICSSVRQFNIDALDKIGENNIQHAYSTGKVICKNGDRYMYLSELHQLRGWHNVEVLDWGGAPDRLKTREAELLFQHARRS